MTILNEELDVFLGQDLLSKCQIKWAVDFYGVFWRYFYVAAPSTLEQTSFNEVPPAEVEHPVLHNVPLRYHVVSFY